MFAIVLRIVIISIALFSSNSGLCCDSIPLTKDHWDIVFDGMGKVEFSSGQLFLQPLKPISPLDTHSALVVSKQDLPAYDFILKIRYKNMNQLRDVSNPWERLWIFFNLQFPKKHSFNQKQTNYTIIKNDSLEIGRAYKERKQFFLATKKFPPTNILKDSQWIDLEISVLKESADFSINKRLFFLFKNKKWPKSLYQQNGKIGLYVEDSAAIVESVAICPI